MAKKTKQVSLDFPFFQLLLTFYKENRGRIRQYYKALSKRFLDYNDPENPTAYLRLPQFEALEIYIFLKEFLDNAPVHKIFREWADKTDHFEGRTIAERSGQLGLFEEKTKEDYDDIFKSLKSYARTYPNYIFALTMGTGKTILMATSIFYEFLLANKFPNDKRFCHNALVFAPDKTVLQSLKEIQTFDMAKVVPPEYVNFLTSNIKFHFLEDSGASLSLIDQSRFNVVVSNTQKIILKRQNKEKPPLEKLLNSGKPTYEPNSVQAQIADLYDFDEPEDDVSLSTNQRFEKLRRVTQLGIYIDEAHHAFGNDLAKDMGVKKTATSLRTTVDELAVSLERAGTHVVACYNFTGTPYVGAQVLPEVVYAFGLQEAIDRRYLKKVQINSYSNTKTDEFVKVAIDNFMDHNQGQCHEGMMPKLAFFAATIDELEKELKPAVERAIADHGLTPDKILVNVGDPKLTTNDEIREFNRLDSIDSEKQFILLVNKGREGWNCRSLFGVALFRQPKSKIFVLQATMRCLRAIGEGQQTGRVYLSEDNKQILENELQQNFRCSIGDIESRGSESVQVQVRVREQKKIKLKRVRHLYTMKEKTVTLGINLELEEALKPENLEKYRLTVTQQEGLSFKDAAKSKKHTEDITHIREKQEYSPMTLVAAIARYLNKPCLWLETILETTVDSMDTILAAVNQHNELLHDWIIPRLFREFYDVNEDKKAETYEVELIKLSKEGYYNVTALPEKTVRYDDDMSQPYQDKSFHLDTYCFDSNPEQQLFWQLLAEKKISKVYFTGMLTHGQSEFYIQYIDPDSHAIRSYYPDFLFQKDDGTYVIVEVKGDNMIDDPVVRAKQEFAEQMATESGMTYRMIKGSDASKGVYSQLLS
jgi:superfamily II DNA or RNA helicase